MEKFKLIVEEHVRYSFEITQEFFDTNKMEFQAKDIKTLGELRTKLTTHEYYYDDFACIRNALYNNRSAILNREYDCQDVDITNNQ